MGTQLSSHIPRRKNGEEEGSEEEGKEEEGDQEEGCKEEGRQEALILTANGSRDVRQPVSIPIFLGFSGPRNPENAVGGAGMHTPVDQAVAA